MPSELYAAIASECFTNYPPDYLHLGSLTQRFYPLFTVKSFKFYKPPFSTTASAPRVYYLSKAKVSWNGSQSDINMACCGP